MLIIDKPYQEAQLKGIAPDVILPEGIAYAHRVDEETDIYFLSNQTDQVQTFRPTFRQDNGEAVLYDPLTDESIAYDGTITLAPYGSLFVQLVWTRSTQGMDKEFTRHGQGFHKAWTKSVPWDISF